MGKCYRQRRVRVASSGVMQGLIDAAYVLTVENSHRTPDFLTRMRQLSPLDVIVVQYNKTYKQCNKASVTSADLDLRHAIARCMKTALKRGERRVLIMEDDCEFLPNQFTRENVTAIDILLNDKDDIDAYFLGCIPMLSMPTANGQHMRIYRGGALHAVLWTQCGMRNFMKRVARTHEKGHVDILITQSLGVYAPILPYAVQKHPDTTNSSAWLHGLDYVIHRHVVKSHLDGEPFYKWTHRCGCIGGTYVVLLSVITICVVICALKIHPLQPCRLIVTPMTGRGPFPTTATTMATSTTVMTGRRGRTEWADSITPCCPQGTVGHFFGGVSEHSVTALSRTPKKKNVARMVIRRAPQDGVEACA